MNALTIIGLALTAIGGIATGLAKDREIEDKVEEEVSKQLALQSKKDKES